MTEQEFAALKVGDEIIIDVLAVRATVLQINGGWIDYKKDNGLTYSVHFTNAKTVKPAPKETGLTLAEVIAAHRETGRAFKRAANNWQMYMIVVGEMLHWKDTKTPAQLHDVKYYEATDYMLEPVSAEPLRVEGRVEWRHTGTFETGSIYYPMVRSSYLVDQNGNEVCLTKLVGKTGRIVFTEESES